MDQKTEQLWIDVMQGMQQRSMQLFNDDDADGRNRNWYARRVYGDRYIDIKNEYQRRKMSELDKDMSRSTYKQ